MDTRTLFRGAALLTLLTAMAGQARAAEEVVRIGQTEAQTGPLAFYGWMNNQGAKLAVEEINRAGGFSVGGKTYKLELVAYDNRANPQEAVVQLKQLLERDKVRFVFGPLLSNTFSAVEPYATQNNGKFLMLSGATAMHAKLGSPSHDYLLRTLSWDGGADGFGRQMVAYLKKQGAKKVAMLFPNDAFTRVATEIYTPLFKEQGIEVVTELFEPGTKDFSASLAKIAATKSDWLFPGYTDAVLFDIVRQATETGQFKKFFLIRGSLAPGLKNKDLLEDYVVYLYKYFEDAEKSSPKARAFVASYQAFYKRDFPYDQAPVCVSSCYDHVYMLVDAMKRAGTVEDVGKVKAALMSLNHDGVWKQRFDKTGEAVFGFDIAHLKKGGALTVTHVDPG